MTTEGECLQQPSEQAQALVAFGISKNAGPMVSDSHAEPFVIKRQEMDSEHGLLRNMKKIHRRTHGWLMAAPLAGEGD